MHAIMWNCIDVKNICYGFVCMLFFLIPFFLLSNIFYLVYIFVLVQSFFFYRNWNRWLRVRETFIWFFLSFVIIRCHHPCCCHCGFPFHVSSRCVVIYFWNLIRFQSRKTKRPSYVIRVLSNCFSQWIAKTILSSQLYLFYFLLFDFVCIRLLFFQRI